LGAVEHHINGDQSRSQPHVLNVSFPAVDSEALMMAMKEKVAFSNGSACTSASYEPSHVLLAMGFDEQRVSSSIRLSWGNAIAQLPATEIVNVVRQIEI